MNSEYFLELIQSSLLLTLRLGLPGLCVAFVVGAAMGALQTLFQIHDTILSGVPRLLAVLLTLGLTLPWMMELLSELFRSSLSTLPWSGG